MTHTMQCLGCKNFAREVSPRMLCVQCEYDYNAKVSVSFNNLYRVTDVLSHQGDNPNLENEVKLIVRDFNNANPLYHPH